MYPGQTKTIKEHRIATTRVPATQFIPEITHPLGRYWEQPDRKLIQISPEHAYMSQKAFDELHEYSSSIPSGKYEGKMWKSHARWREGEKIIDQWSLVWYDVDPDPNMLSIKKRVIIVE